MSAPAIASDSAPAIETIQAVTFDVGGTLIEPWPSVGHVYAEVAARQGHGHLSPETLNRQFAGAWQARKSFDYSRRAWLGLVEQTFAGLIEPSFSPLLFNALYSRFEEPDAWRVFDDVHPTLAALRSRGFKLGVVSNWDERLRPLLERLGLHHYFDATAISVEVGFTKPAPEIFQRILALMDLPPASVLHVGDSATEDLRGARSAGLHARLVGRNGPREANLSLLSLAELPPLLRNSNPKKGKIKGA